MKKLIASLMAAGMLLGASPVFAAETEAAGPVVVNWSDVVEQVEAAGSDVISQGNFYTFNAVSVQMWAPQGMEPKDLTDEDIEKGFTAYFATPEEDAVVAAVYVDGNGMDLEGYKEVLAEDEEVANLSDCIFNGLSCIGYDLPEKDTRCLAFEADDGHFLEFTFHPVSDENYSTALTMMMASIQPEQQEETES